MNSRIIYLIGLSLAMADFSSLGFIELMYDSRGIPKEKKNYPFYKTKTYHQNPNINSQISYYNKIIPKNIDSHISQKGLNIKKENQRIKIKEKSNKQLKERALEKILKK